MSHRSFEQPSDATWPSGRDKPIAVIKASPSELESLGIVFVGGRDDLDTFKQAGLRLPSGRLILLQRYQHEPKDGTAAYADYEDNTAEAQAELASALGLPADAFSWLRPTDDST